MKEKIKTALIIALLILSILLIIRCRTRHSIICPGHSPRTITVIKDSGRFAERNYETPLTRRNYEKVIEGASRHEKIS